METVKKANFGALAVLTENKISLMLTIKSLQMACAAGWFIHLKLHPDVWKAWLHKVLAYLKPILCLRDGN